MRPRTKASPKPLASLLTFFFPASKPGWAIPLRIGTALSLIYYCSGTRQNWLLLFMDENGGLINRRLGDFLASRQSPFIPTIGLLVRYGRTLGMSDSTIITVTWTLLTIAALCLLAGFFARSSAITAWLLHLCAAKSGSLLSYGADNFITIALFYLALAPLPDRFSLDYLIRRRPPQSPVDPGFLRRVVQLHLCLIYFFGGLTKALGSGWWDGLNLWQAMTREPFNIIRPDLLARFAPLLFLGGLAVWIIELGYPILIWPQRTRSLWLGSICGLHLAIGLGMGMYLFALIAITLNVAAFASFHLDAVGRHLAESDQETHADVAQSRRGPRPRDRAHSAD